MGQDSARLVFSGQEYILPVFTGSDGKMGVDIQHLYKDTGLYSYDPLLNNTAVAKSSITYIDSEHGKLYYRGHDIEDLVVQSSFAEAAYLLMNNKLPTQEEWKKYSTALSTHSLIHEAMKNFFYGFAGNTHPLATLATMVTSLSNYYPDSYEEQIHNEVDIQTLLLAKIRTLAAWSYKKSIGQPVIYPLNHLSYCANFLNMMFAVPAEPYVVPQEDECLLNQVLILYSDHEQNIATTTVRLLSSSGANLFVCISAGICALWGARETSGEIHTMAMLKTILGKKMKPADFFAPFLEGKETLYSPAFGHKKYTWMGPRARIAQKIFWDYAKKYPDKAKSPLIQKAFEIEDFVLNNSFFTKNHLFPNLDFYSALLFNMIGIPESMFNVVRVIGKLAGWLAHWEEQKQSTPPHRHMRPQQIYLGTSKQKYIPIELRKNRGNKLN